MKELSPSDADAVMSNVVNQLERAFGGEWLLTAAHAYMRRAQVFTLLRGKYRYEIAISFTELLFSRSVAATARCLHDDMVLAGEVMFNCELSDG